MKNNETLFLKALESTSSGNIDHAREIAGDILKNDQKFGKAHYLMGWILFESTNEIEKAGEHAKLAMKYDPCNPLGYYLYCDILIANKDLEGMKSVTEGVQQLKIIDKAFLYHKLACIYELRKQYESAIASLRESKLLGKTESWDNFVDDEILRIKRKVGVNIHSMQVL